MIDLTNLFHSPDAECECGSSLFIWIGNVKLKNEAKCMKCGTEYSVAREAEETKNVTID